MENHLRMHSGERPFRCDLCPRAFATASALAGHVLGHKAAAAAVTPACARCGALFASPEELAGHECAADIPAIEPPSSPSYLSVNALFLGAPVATFRVSGDKFLSEYYCPGSTTNITAHWFFTLVAVTLAVASRSLLSPLALLQPAGAAAAGGPVRRPFHARGEKFYCDCCAYTTTHKWNMVVHVRTHTGERPFRCSLCPKSFSRKNVLEEHVHTHTGARPFRCSLCPVAFAHKNSLVTHLKRHVGERPFTCPECGRAFAGRFALNRHLMAHARAAP
ncbi:uncharacterized protein LOC144159913 [Haemaphysalis longicornis]